MDSKYLMLQKKNLEQKKNSRTSHQLQGSSVPTTSNPSQAKKTAVQ